MKKLVDLIGYFIDDNGEIKKEIDLTNTEDREKVQQLIDEVKSFRTEMSDSFFGGLFQSTFDKFFNNDLAILEEALEKTKEENVNECDYPLQETTVTDENINHFSNIVDTYMKEVILPNMNMSEKDQKNMKQAFVDFACWIYQR